VLQTHQNPDPSNESPVVNFLTRLAVTRWITGNW